MPEEQKHSEKLEKLIENDLFEWFKELIEDSEFPIEGKVAIGAAFNAAVVQLRTVTDQVRARE